MMAPLPGYFPAGSKSGWQLFCADFKDQREKDKAEQQTAGAAEEKSGSSQDGGNDDGGEGGACSSCGGRATMRMVPARMPSRGFRQRR